MDPDEQLELVRDFMLAVAPAVSHAHLDQGGYMPTETAKATLELAMHLASQYAACHDALHAAPENAPKKISAPQSQPETKGPATPLR